jgi:CRISPR-associated exonuclease Cas4
MISVSTLTSYQYCSRKFYLEYVLKLAKPPKESLVKGTIRHNVHDFANKKEKDIVKQITKDFDLIQIEELYKKNYSEILREAIRVNRSELEKLQIDMGQLFKESWPLILSESKLRAMNTFKFAQKYNVFGEELWEKLTPKIESEFFLESRILGLRGIIDQVEIYENDFVPYELKTGKVPEKGVWPNHKIQIGAYILMLQEKYGKPIKEAFVKYLDSDEARQITMNPFLKDEILALIKKVNETLVQKEIPVYTQNENKCKNCELSQECHDEPTLRSLLLNNRNL